MVWGALNRANSIDDINRDLRATYITQNEKMKMEYPEADPDTCAFIKKHVELSQNAEWVGDTKQKLGL